MEIIKKIKKQIPWAKISLIAILSHSVLGLLFIFLRRLFPPEYPLWFAKAEGQAQLGRGYQALWLNLLPILIIIINSAITFKTESNFVKNILTSVAIIIAILFAFIQLKIFSMTIL